MKKLISLLLALALLLAACGQRVISDEPSPEASTPEAETPDTLSRYPRTVTDQAGREVVIEREPESLISSYYITTSLIMALGAEDRLVGVEDNPDYRPIYSLSCPRILELPSIGTAKELDLESCAMLMPDLAILPMKVKNSAETLEAMGITVLIVNPENQELLVEMIRLVGLATGTEEKAEELLRFLSGQEARLSSALAGARKPRVYLAGNSGMLRTAGDAMYQSDLIRLAGGTNVAAEIKDTYWTEIDYEQLLAWDPEYIILASSAKYTVEDVLNDPNLAGCSAIVNKKVYRIPSDAESWDSPVPSSILGAFWLANILHPQLLSDGDCASVMNEYYETFYHFTYPEN